LRQNLDKNTKINKKINAIREIFNILQNNEKDEETKAKETLLKLKSKLESIETKDSNTIEILKELNSVT